MTRLTGPVRRRCLDDAGNLLFCLVVCGARGGCADLLGEAPGCSVDVGPSSAAVFDRSAAYDRGRRNDLSFTLESSYQKARFHFRGPRFFLPFLGGPCIRSGDQRLILHPWSDHPFVPHQRYSIAVGVRDSGENANGMEMRLWRPSFAFLCPLFGSVVPVRRYFLCPPAPTRRSTLPIFVPRTSGR